jgi:hypothetical protein
MLAGHKLLDLSRHHLRHLEHGEVAPGWQPAHVEPGMLGRKALLHCQVARIGWLTIEVQRGDGRTQLRQCLEGAVRLGIGRENLATGSCPHLEAVGPHLVSDKANDLWMVHPL